MELDRRGVTEVQYLPKWLAPTRQMNADLKQANQRFIRLSLTYFHGAETERLILLAAAAYRRVFKVLLMMDEGQWRLAEARHFIQRFEMPERSWSQIVGSPAGYALGILNASAMMATYRFVQGVQVGDGPFKLEVAKLQLRQIWDMEKKLLAQFPQYRKVRDERNLGELFPTEWCCVTYDYLGHLALCLLPPFPVWREHILKHHQPELERLSNIGSWSAREMLGLKMDQTASEPADTYLADRFFLGDVETFRALRASYTGESKTN